MNGIKRQFNRFASNKIYVIEDNISLQIHQTAINCTRQEAENFLSIVDSFISNAKEDDTRQLLQTLKDDLRGMNNIYSMHMCTCVVIITFW